MIKPTTSEELKLYNYLRELDCLGEFENVKRMGLDCKFSEKIEFEGKIDLFRYLLYGL